MRFEQMPEVQDRRLVRDRIASEFEIAERAHRLDIVERFLGARIRQIVPLLQAVDAQTSRRSGTLYRASRYLAPQEDDPLPNHHFQIPHTGTRSYLRNLQHRHNLAFPHPGEGVGTPALTGYLLLGWQPRIGFDPIGTGRAEPSLRGGDGGRAGLTGLHVQP